MEIYNINRENIIKRTLIKTKLLVIVVNLIAFPTIGNSQPNYKVKETNEFDIKLSGTSTIKDWEMDALNSNGEADFIIKQGSKNDLVSLLCILNKS